MQNKLPKYEGEKIENGTIISVSDYISIEEELQININNKAFTVIMRSPYYDEELVRGLFYNEDIYSENENFKLEIIKTNKLGYVTEVNINIKDNKLSQGYKSSRSLLSIASCGICGKQKLDKFYTKQGKLKKAEFDARNISKLLALMKQQQNNFHLSGGSHAAALFNKKGELLAVREDIGRHNAVDKVIGKLLIESKLTKAQFITVSGRISYEIIAKVFRSRIPVLIAVSAPSSLAIDFAKEFGITIFGFCRNGKATKYS
jgi:FdhD protein